MKRYWPLAAIILILQILAFLTSYFVTENAVNGWYQSINKSSLNLPDWVFAPVWTILYAMLGLALWKLWPMRHDPRGRKALIFFLIQLGLNYLWSPVFFGLGAFAAALGIIILMVGFTIGCMMNAGKIVSWLLAPYLAWISFATWLTYCVTVMN